MGFNAFMETIDAIVMGRNTFDMVNSFDCDWPYSRPVFVLSHFMQSVPEALKDKVFLARGAVDDVIQQIHGKGFKRLYIDGGVTVQNFLKQDRIDEMIITTIPVVLGGGVPLFGTLEAPLKFRHVKSERYLDCLVQNYFVRER